MYSQMLVSRMSVLPFFYQNVCLTCTKQTDRHFLGESATSITLLYYPTVNHSGMIDIPI